MGISRDSRHKRSASGAKRSHYRKKRKFELGRQVKIEITVWLQAAMTKIGAKRIHVVRVRGGNTKFRALRLETGNFSWATNAVAKKCRIIRVVYNATNNELVRTNTLVKSSIVEVASFITELIADRRYPFPSMVRIPLRYSNWQKIKEACWRINRRSRQEVEPRLAYSWSP